MVCDYAVECVGGYCANGVAVYFDICNVVSAVGGDAELLICVGCDVYGSRWADAAACSCRRGYGVVLQCSVEVVVFGS